MNCSKFIRYNAPFSTIIIVKTTSLLCHPIRLFPVNDQTLRQSDPRLHTVLHKGFQNCPFIAKRAQHLSQVYRYDFTWYVLVNIPVCMFMCRCVCLWSFVWVYVCTLQMTKFLRRTRKYIRFVQIFPKLMTLSRKDFIRHDVLLHFFRVIISVSFSFLEKCTSLTHFIYLKLAGSCGRCCSFSAFH